ncbi:MAG: hypothetical protein AAGD01_19425 [Acidobacteriota bacterium]
MSDSDMKYPRVPGADGGFDLTHWSDFVRGALDTETQKIMERALLGADEATRRSVGLLKRVASVGHIDSQHQAPPWALRCAYAIGSLRREPEPQGRSWLRRLSHRITFDSLLASPAFGTREIASPHRRLVIEAAPYALDLRLEREGHAADWAQSTTVVVGQLLEYPESSNLKSQDPESLGSGISPAHPQPVVDVPVLVLDGGRVVERDRTTEFGEFQAEGLQGESLELCLLISDDACLHFPLSSDDYHDPLGRSSGKEAP